VLHFYWGARRPSDRYEHALVCEWARRYPNLIYRPVLSHAQAGDAWNGATGWVHEVALAQERSFVDAVVYASGPPAMIDAIRHDYPKAGLAAGDLLFDSFDYAPDSPARRPGG